MTDTERSRWDDEVLRIKDEMDMHAVLKQSGWVIFSLNNGAPLDHFPYETWNDAVRAAKWDRDNYIYLEIQPDGMTFREARAVLDYARTLSRAGYRIPSPEWESGPMTASMPMQPGDRVRMIRQLKSGKPLLPDDIPYSNLPGFRKVT